MSSRKCEEVRSEFDLPDSGTFKAIRKPVKIDVEGISIHP